MEDIKKHLTLFSKPIRSALEKFQEWDKICEIRLRKNLPVSLTSYSENILINEKGEKTTIEKAITSTEEDLTYLLGSFCKGCVYRYFDNLKEGFAVDEEGWRLGLCERKRDFGDFLSQSPNGINLRIPRNIVGAADDLFPIFQKEGLFSALIISAPGDGKTTLLRDLARSLSEGKCTQNPLRVCVIDQREELFPQKMLGKGLLDRISGMDKKSGIETATRLFSPQVILCDEIGSEEEANALISSCTGGAFVFASCHGRSLEEAQKMKHLKALFESNLFDKAITIKRSANKTYQRTLIFKDLK